MNEKLTAVFGDPVDPKALAQIETVLEDERAVAGALMADNHLGYSMPIGGVVAYKDAISPSGVGFDIACGNKCVRTDMAASTLGDVKPWMRMIQKEVAFGIGRKNPKPVDHELFDSPLWPTLESESKGLKQKAADQLGTVGSGNHYVDLLEDEEGTLWIANHFGSRGFGHTVATMGLRWAYGLGPDDRKVERDDAAVLDLDTDSGQLYLEAMQLAGEYAYAGRDFVIEQVLSLLGRPNVTLEVHNHHNYAWKEDGLWVVRKGATPLTLDPAFIGGSMGDISVIVRGKWEEVQDVGADRDLRIQVEDIGALGSAPHGAGRVMSRTAAAGKLRKMWYCNDSTCPYQPVRSIGNAHPGGSGKCPECGKPLRKRRMRDTSDAKVDWAAVRKDLNERGITVLGSGADEAPEVYKDLMSVINQHKNIEVLHTLSPLGVVMAGDDTFDPYQD